MANTRFIIAAFAVTALGACSGGDEGTSPLGYELAVASEERPRAEAPEVVELTPAQLREKLEAGSVRLIDVRSDEEVAEGMIPGAEHIALDDFRPAEMDLSDGREVVLYCRSGRRSGIAAERLAAHTGEPAEHLAGGILGWQEAGEEITTP